VDGVVPGVVAGIELVVGTLCVVGTLSVVLDSGLDVVISVVLVLDVVLVVVVVVSVCAHWVSAAWLTVEAPWPRFWTSLEFVPAERF
jgi:hypothetical protein